LFSLESKQTNKNNLQGGFFMTEITTKTLGAKELIDKLTLEAVNIFYLIGNPDDLEVSRLESIIALVAEAWNLPQEIVEKSREIIAAERDATRREIRGEQVQGVISEEELPKGNSGEEIMVVLWMLFETVVRLDAQDKREQVLQCAHFWAEYLGMEE
jgi:hypothetical protein